MIRTVTPILSIIAALLIFFTFSKPMFTEIEQIENETDQYGEAAARASELNGELSRKLTEKRSYPAEALEKLEALVPDTVNEVKILSDLNEMARAHNLLFGNVTVTKNDPAKSPDNASTPGVVTYDTLATSDLDFSVIGSYDQFKAFLNDIEQSLVMMEITNIDFLATDGELQQYNFSARVFALPQTE